MNFILILFFILITIWLINNYFKKKKLKSLIKKYSENWGKPKKNDYYNFHAIGKYFENNTHKKKAFHIISDKTQLDLDINELFKFIDRTSSKIGQQYLYFKLRTVGSISELIKFDKLVEVFLKNKKLRLNCQILLSQLNNDDSYDLEELINGQQIQKPRIIWLVYLLSFSSFLFLILGFFNPFFFLLLIPIYCVNMFFHYRNKSYIVFYLNAVIQLSKSLRVAKELSCFFEIKRKYNDFSFIKKINAIRFKTEFIGFEKNANDELTFVFWFIIEFIKILFNIEYLIFFSLIKSIVKERESIEDLFVFIGEVDAAISTASIKSGKYEYCIPNFVKNKNIATKGIYHPLIPNCILNDINLSNRSMLLTGSNMSGKTTFIRALGLNSLLAQTLNICFAKEYYAPFFKLYSSIRISDDILQSKSYYLEEVLTIKQLIRVSRDTNPSLFILDEMFKGTNTIERVSASKAVLSYLNYDNNIVLASSHDIELTEKIDIENYQLYHFSEYINKCNELSFDYKLKLGSLKTGNAIKILELYGYPTEIINDANKRQLPCK
ncbi:MutS-related protein [Tenacibaculum finnmarkense]|uniref:MutS-related protein n=1 Tax=Tenacibaculum finnmarkense TaxID=2781243 RepID=UPI00187B5D5B|nr:DNA mismatch repair protein MutS [Tenacibaculum finnmarkense]MBE7648122.1 DNA mismatch repair protein MutS [Tenacibaculum finnmarkense genomovar ulcerans]MCG8795184.1 DNA mismatch repair protein MutS [Tenacibaculum finnmarkense]MCG8797511.1 DNA mismatch repair protein MutS [Tenacibaculum finnmarkense]